jgi:ribosomal protein L3 glutamine methyltransferase
MARKTSVTSDLFTVRDYIRYALSRFTEAKLFYGHGTFSPLEDAVFIVMESLNLPFGDLDPWWDAKLTAAERAKVAGLIDARVKTRKPSAYLLNKTYLQDIPFYVDERVIVPRSYLAELIVNGLSGVEDFPLIDDPASVTSVLDLCTGSGCLAIIAAHVFPYAAIDAVELSPKAHAVAKINFDQSEMRDRLSLHKGDLFKPVGGRKYDLIITNPPYVAPESMKDLPPEYAHEPRMALAGGGHDGLDIVRRILAEAPELDTETSTGEVFWITREELVEARGARKRRKKA